MLPIEFYLTDELYHRSQCERIYVLALLFTTHIQFKCSTKSFGCVTLISCFDEMVQGNKRAHTHMSESVIMVMLVTLYFGFSHLCTCAIFSYCFFFRFLQVLRQWSAFRFKLQHISKQNKTQKKKTRKNTPSKHAQYTEPNP